MQRSTVAFLAMLVVGLASPARAGQKFRNWYFPKPFTMSSPMTPYRSGGMEIGYIYLKSGHGLAFPIESSMRPFGKNFAAELSMPLGLGVPDGGSTEFYGGNPTLGLTGFWRFLTPFAGGHAYPSALAVGADIGIPLAMAWGENNGAFGFALYHRDYVAWRPVFGVRPKVIYAIGKPIFFVESELGFPAFTVDKGGHATALIDWGITLGSQFHEMVALMLEFGGAHDMKGSDFQPVWGALSSRLYFGKFVTGMMLIVPFRRFGEDVIGLSVYVGYEMREQI
ncbi:MAG: hypothetical protein JXR96_16920 [Deltaproteobacteria bacterium]|nr:hypothetical protein [Deltaproteobacteria bacterium]